MAEVVQECKMGFARKLASPNLKTREKAISLLVTWLTSKKHIEDEELKKIWKGLFYCVWHSDKVLVQTELIERLTSISEKLDTRLSLQFFKIFLMTMRREWAGIDRLRLDKFYLLLKRYLVHMFVVLESSGWDANLTKEFMDALVTRTFLAKDQHAASGINLHYADVFLKELERFLPLQGDTFRILLEPFLEVIAYALDKSLLKRIRENVFGCILDHGRAFILAKKNGTIPESASEQFGCLILSWPVGADAFKLASMPSVSQVNRKILYELHRDFETLEKLLSTSGIMHSLSGKKKRKKSVQQSNSGDKKRKNTTKHGIKTFDENTQACQTTKTVENNREGLKDQNISTNSKDDNPTKEKMNLGKQNVPKCHTDSSSAEKDASRKMKKLSKKVSKCLTDPVMRTCNSPLSSCRKSSESWKEGALLDDVEKIDSMVKDCRTLTMGNSVISNLKRQFDILAGEEDSESDSYMSPAASITVVSPRNTGSKKRKKVVPTDGTDSSENVEVPVVANNSNTNTPDNSMHVSSSVKAKRVRFALKKNLVWRPTSPLPPESVRVPPSATPRGSALKKGVPPGPIITEVNNATILRQRKGTPRRPSHINVRKNMKQIRALHKRRSGI